MAPELYKHWRKHFDSNDDVNFQYFLGDPIYMRVEIFILRHIGLNERPSYMHGNIINTFNRCTHATMYM